MRKAENRVTCPKQQGNDRAKSTPTNHSREVHSLLNTLAWKRQINEISTPGPAKISFKNLTLLIYWYIIYRLESSMHHYNRGV